VSDGRLLAGLRVAILRPLGHVAQDTRLHNVAWSLAAAGADVTVLHLAPGAQVEERTDEHGVTWWGAPTSGLMLGAAQRMERDRQSRRWLGADAGRFANVSKRRRALHLAEVDVALADEPGTLRRLRLRASRTRLELGGKVVTFEDRVVRAINRRTQRVRNRSTALASWRRQVPDNYAFEVAFGDKLDELVPDVVHSHDLPALGVAVRYTWRAKTAGREARVVLDAIEDWAGLPYYRYITPRYLAAMLEYEAEYIGGCDAVITVSRMVADALVARHPSLPTPTLVMSCPRAGTQVAAHLDLREELGVAADVPLVLYSGGINAARGLDIAIDALPLLPGWHLGIVALPYPHQMEPDLRARAAGLGVADRVSFAPPVPGPEIVSYLSGADIGILPASNEFANLRAAMPNKLFEYLNAGLPVVSSDLPEMAAFLERYDVGTSFAYPSVEGFAQAVLEAHRRMPEGVDARRREALGDTIEWESQEKALWDAYLGLGIDRSEGTS
jgi:glycosyltransferase involved in cell wall biosynthesis